MRILAVDTALGACSVAILDDDTPLARDFAVMARGHAEALAPMVEAVMKKAAFEFASIQRLAVTTGPGTFTGQRVGLSFMRGLRIALNVPLVGVTTLSAMAAQAMAETGHKTGAAIHDARRDEVYLEVAGDSTLAACLLSFDAAVRHLESIASPFVLAGTAAPRALERLRQAALSGVRQPDALWVGRLARNLPAPATPPKPLYLRPPDAKLPVRK